MKKGYYFIIYFQKPIASDSFTTFPQYSQPAVENLGRAFLIDFNIFLKKINFNTLFIDFRTVKSKGLKEVINSLLTFVENLG